MEVYCKGHDLRHRMSDERVGAVALVSLGWMLASVLGLLLTRCAQQAPTLVCDSVPAGAEPKDALTLARHYEQDEPFRRRCLESSLINPENGYAKARLAHYTAESWGRLPVASFPTRPVVAADLGKPIPSPDPSWEVVPSGNAPKTQAELRARGEQMFLRFPAQIERSMISVLREKDGPERYGLWQSRDSVGGLVWVALPGGVFPALSCSSCHASVDADGTLRAGVPNHRLDLGKAIDDYTHMPSLYSTWGSGRIDIAADGRDNPVVIADVRAVRYQSYLHRNANVKNSLVALALRVETGLIVAHHNAVRPKPADAFALAYYLWTLGSQLDAKAATRHPGRDVFEKHCGRCHRGSSLAGTPILPQAINSPVADMPSVARGTGRVQIPSLLGVSARARLLYGGEAHGLEALLDPNRESGGHYVGKQLSPEERHTLLAYLKQL